MMWYLRYSIRIRGFPRHQAAIHGCATEVGFAFQQDLWQTDKNWEDHDGFIITHGILIYSYWECDD